MKNRQQWESAQLAEADYWYSFGIGEEPGSPRRKALINDEVTKGDFIFRQMVEHFDINPVKDWQGKAILDVGCGPLSLVARNQLGKTRTGVDPLKYPDWVYQDYSQHDFKVMLQPFEELETDKKFDVIVFYNALQHFADLSAVAQKCQTVLAKGGIIYLSEYLEVPTDHAHIHMLNKLALDAIFTKAGFKVDSVSKPVRLEGYVELAGGNPITLYMARALRFEPKHP